MERFTKVTDQERKLLREANSVNAYEIYFHLKNDKSYFKGEFTDLYRCIGEYLDIPERSVKDAIKRLKGVGLIETSKRGKANVYTLPYASETPKKQEIKVEAERPKVEFKLVASKDRESEIIERASSIVTKDDIELALGKVKDYLGESENMRQIEYTIGYRLKDFNRAEKEIYYKFLIKNVKKVS